MSSIERQKAKVLLAQKVQGIASKISSGNQQKTWSRENINFSKKAFKDEPSASESFQRVMSFNENLIHEGFGSLSQTDIIKLSALSKEDLSKSFDCYHFDQVKSSPYPKYFDNFMSRDKALERFSQIGKQFENDKDAGTQALKLANCLSNDNPPALSSKDPLETAQRLELIKDTNIDMSKYFIEKSSGKEQLQSQHHQEFNDKALHEMLENYNPPKSEVENGTAKKMMNAAKTMLSESAKIQKEQEKLIDAVSKDAPEMTFKEYKENIREKQAEVDRINNEIVRVDNELNREVQRLGQELMAAGSNGAKLAATQQALATSIDAANNEKKQLNEKLAEAQQALDDAKALPHKESLPMQAKTVVVNNSVAAYKASANAVKGKLQVFKEGVKGATKIVKDANERFKFEGKRAYNGVDRAASGLLIKGLEVAKQIDQDSLARTQNLQNKLNKVMQKIMDNPVGKSVRLAANAQKHVFKSLIGKGDMKQYQKEQTAIQSAQYQTKLLSGKIAELKQSIKGQGAVIARLEDGRKDKAAKFVDKNQKYITEDQLDKLSDKLGVNKYTARDNFKDTLTKGDKFTFDKKTQTTPNTPSAPNVNKEDEDYGDGH